MPFEAREVDSSLTSKGFQKVDRDHHFYFLWVNGKKTAVRTMISHGEKEISDSNCGNMAKQMKITGPQFRDFVDCKLKHEGYIEILVQRGELQRPQAPAQAKPAPVVNVPNPKRKP